MYEVENLINAAREAVRGTSYKGTAEGYLQKAINITRNKDYLTADEKADMIQKIKAVASSLGCYVK